MVWTLPIFADSNGWLTRIQNQWFTKSGSQWTSRTLTQNDYAYNNAGMRTANQISDQTGIVRTESYGYDELYRLTSVNYGDSHTQSYAFDAMGNRLTKVNDGVSENYSYNAANMLLTRGAIPYTNDSNGNTLTGGSRTNVWDSQNRLAQCTFGATTSTFTYAADGIRHRTVTGGNTTDYVLDGPMFVREKLNGAVSATYLVGPRGPEYRRDHTTGTIRWYCYDGLGSVLGECDSSGNLTATRSYDVYGAVRTSAGTSTSKHKYVGSLGHPSEDESGLIYMRARYMDPVTGRFISEDPQQDGNNWYAYCESSPTNGSDPSGRSYWSLFLAILCALGMAMGTSLGYAITTLLFRSLFPGYKGGNVLGGVLLTFAGGVMGLGAGVAANPDDLVKGKMSITKFAKGVANALKEKGWGQAGNAFGIGFVVGLIFGVASALCEFFMSDYYAESYHEE